MKKHCAIERNCLSSAMIPGGIWKVLSVGQHDEDHSSLQGIIDDPKHVLIKAHDLGSAVALLQRHDIAVVLCKQDLLPGSYVDLLEQIKALPNAPSMIVTSRFADDRLWAEALNLGAWDVLATPFDRDEVVRTVASGWRHWQRQHHSRAKAVVAAAN